MWEKFIRSWCWFLCRLTGRSSLSGLQDQLAGQCAKWTQKKLQMFPTSSSWPALLWSSSSRRYGVQHHWCFLTVTFLSAALSCLSSQCDFLSDAHSPGVFCPRLLCVATGDLQQLMATFGHVYDTDLRAYCSRDPPSFSEEIGVFQRTHRLLHALITVQRGYLQTNRNLWAWTLSSCVSFARSWRW